MKNPTNKQTIEYLLPFYVNGSLNDEEKKQVEEALTEDSDLREELNYLQQLHLQIKQQPRENSPGELGLKRLQRTLKAESATNQDTGLSVEKNRWRMAAMAACLMLVVQTVTHIDSQDGDTFTVAGGPTPSHYKGKTVSITFTPEATEQGIRTLLLKEKAMFIDGPSALGVYRLYVSGDIQQFAANLESQPDLIESVQEE